jgi:hypothetical protein
MRLQPLHPSYEGENRLDGLFRPKTLEEARRELAEARKKESKRAYAQSAYGRQKTAEAQARYYQTEKGKEARKRASKKQAEKRKLEGGSFDRKVLREQERVRKYIAPRIQQMTPDEREAYLLKAFTVGVPELIEALHREGF